MSNSLINSFNAILSRYGSPVTWRQRKEGEIDERGHPQIEFTETDIKAFIHRNSGNEYLLSGQLVKSYDAYLLTNNENNISEGDEILTDNILFKVNEVINNITHVECRLKKIEA